MHIDAIVLDNFKSFGRKTRIPFYEDFTTISGPNGSGKSNIIDGVLFALGLARTSGIRAEKLTDLIYNPGHHGESGSSGPREATVEVVLNNTDGTLDRQQVVSAAGTDKIGDVETVSIRRRVKETEDNYYSYYYLNDRSVNLSDIHDLLAQAGIAPEGYNVVMQGDVTEIINMTAGTRREIIDEIAGVAEFDEKKAQAFDELETVEERIEEADLRIEEKSDRLDQLEDERETALEYRELREEKETYETYERAAKLERKREQLADREADLEALQERREGIVADLDEREARVESLEAELRDLDAEIQRKGEDEQLELKREIEGLKGERSRLADRRAAAEEAIEDAENERREAFVEIDRKQETVEQLETDIRDHKVEKSSLAAERQDFEAELEEVTAEIDALDDTVQEIRERLEGRKADLEAAKSEQNELQREQDRLIDEARRRSDDQEEIEDDLAAARERVPEIETEIAALADERRKAEQNRETIEEVIGDLQDERQSIQADLDTVEDDLSAAQEEYARLEATAEESGDGSFGRAVTTLLDSQIEGVHGPVARLASVDPQYATALETAAGGRMAHVVVDDDAVGERCIDHLKQRNAGRATVLPITEMEDRSLGRLPDDPGVIDFAVELLDFDPEYRTIFEYVVGDTIVVEDMATARALMGQFRIVTLEGDLVEKSGAMTGGSTSGSRHSFSGSRGQLDRVASRINDLETRRRELREELRDVEGRIEDARDRKADATEQLRDVEREIDALETERDDLEAEIDDLETRLDEIDAEREAVADEMDELDATIDEKRSAIEAIESDIADLEADIEDSRLAELTERADELRGEIADRKSAIDDRDARLNELALEKEYAEDAIDDLEDRVATAKERIADREEEIDEIDAEIEGIDTEIEAKNDEIAALESELVELKDERDELSADLEEAREARDATRRERDRVGDEIESAEAEIERRTDEIAEIEAEVGEYDPEEIPDHHTVRTKIGQLESRMAALEPVNMLAIDEYDEVAADLADLEAKRDTLRTEADEIRARIDGYETQKRETFLDTFEAIDQHFQGIFERLSNGTGQLHLEDEDDPFEGGLTMKAQPGDKPIQRLDAMSGGEKSLTALAFIFAIQRHNPAPFYALDEVDAFLDAANADLVGEMVDELAGDAQFVVVSHRSAMLERSERAIGVTITADNVSEVTGIDLSSEGVPADD
ncbi:MAG: chromosome segregation protein SMC [Halococcoides sp.]